MFPQSLSCKGEHCSPVVAQCPTPDATPGTPPSLPPPYPLLLPLCLLLLTATVAIHCYSSSPPPPPVILLISLFFVSSSSMLITSSSLLSLLGMGVYTVIPYIGILEIWTCIGPTTDWYRSVIQNHNSWYLDYWNGIDPNWD